MTRIEFLGHASFLIEGTESILIDPFLSGNPRASATPEDLDPDLILITHAHDDHVGDAVAISKRMGCPVMATFDLANHLESMGAHCIHMNVGGEFHYPWGRVKVYHAMHPTASFGSPVSYVIDMDGKTIYHAGDTGIFGDMGMIGGMHRIDVALLPIGGTFTMGPEDAAMAASMLRAKTVVPMHFGTFDAIDVDPGRLRDALDGPACVVLEPGESMGVE